VPLQSEKTAYGDTGGTTEMNTSGLPTDGSSETTTDTAGADEVLVQQDTSETVRETESVLNDQSAADGFENESGSNYT